MAVDLLTGEAIGQTENEEEREAPVRQQTSMPVSMLAGLSQGVTAQFGDELYGAMAGAPGVPGGLGGLLGALGGGMQRREMGLPPMGYEERRDTARELNRQARADNPWSYGLSEFAGAMTLPSLAGGIPRAAAPAERAIAGALAGGAEGALAAYGGFEEGDSVDVGSQLALGGGMGAATGFLSPLVPGMVGIGRQLRQRAFDRPAQRAARVIGEDLVRGSGLDSGARVAQEIEAIGPQAMLADVAPDSAVAATSRVGGGDLMGALSRRQARAPSRVMKIIEDALGVDVSAYSGRVAGLREEAQALGDIYNEIKTIPLPREAFADLLDIDSPMLRSAVREAAAAVRENPEGLYRNFEPDGDVLPLEFIDQVKRQLDGMAEQAGGLGSGLTGAQGGRASALARQMRDRADQVVESYRPARDAYGDVLQRLQALGSSPAGQAIPQMSGRRMFSTRDPARMEDIGQYASEMAKDILPDFRLGAARGALDVVEARQTRTGDVARAFRADTEGSMGRRALEIAAGSPGAARRAGERLLGESQMQETFRRLDPMSGSRTQPNQSAVSRAGFSAWAMVSELLGGQGLRESTAKEMRRLLARGDLTERQLQDMVDRGVRSGVIEATPEQVQAWMDYTVRGYRAAYGALSGDSEP